MRNLKLCTIVFVLVFYGFLTQAGICDDPLKQREVCLEMKHLQSQILVLGAQRDLLQLNYPLLELVGLEVQGISSRIKNVIIDTDPGHRASLNTIAKQSEELSGFAANKNPQALVTANNIQHQCLSCHTKGNPGDLSWSDIFKNDWSMVYAKCNQPNRNPYTCKNMYGMLSYVSSFFTAAQLGLQNYELTSKGALEIEKMAFDLTEKHLLHAGDFSLNKVIINTKEISELALERNPLAFERAAEITQICMQCHADRPRYLSKFLQKK